jgi:FkbM family methyltransferase
MIGEFDALRYATRDLPVLETVLEMTPGRTACVQAGGNLGVWPKRLAKDFATVYTFEPAADLFAALCRKAPEPNIVKFQAAVGEKPALVGLSRERRDGKPNNHVGITHVSGEGTVPVLQIDALALPVCDLIYLDVEGFELSALRGAAVTLRQCRPVVAVEINKSIGFYGHSGDDVRAFLDRCDYREVGQLQADVVFLPKEWS